jgi:hypothetical protein
MLKHNQYCHLLQCRIYRLLFILFLVLFTIYPILDIYADSVNYSTVNLDIADDSSNDSDQISLSYHNSHTPFISLFLSASTTIDNPACSIIKRAIPSNEIKSHQSCPPLSSDLSPPLV